MKTNGKREKGQARSDAKGKIHRDRKETRRKRVSAGGKERGGGGGDGDARVDSSRRSDEADDKGER